MDDPDGQPIGLAPITLADRPHFDRAFAALQQPITDYSFASTFVWSASLKLYWARLDQHLCLFANGTGDLTMLMPPIPEPGAPVGTLKACIDHCFEVMDAYNARHANRTHSRIEYVSDEMLEHISGARGVTLSATPMSGDYVYDMARMIDLAGGSLKSKRHARSKFMRLYPDHRTEPLTENHVPACMELLEHWHQRGDDSHEGEVNDAHIGSDILRHREAVSCQMALKHWRTLGLKAMSLFVGERLIGFTFGEALSPTQASILIEKTHPDYDGAAQFIFSEFCRQYWSEFPECNAGDDWGIPSLRFTKESYRPIRLLSKYVLTRQAPVVVGAPAIDMPVENPSHAVAAASGDGAHAQARDDNDPAAAVVANLGTPVLASQAAPLPIELRIARVEDVPAILELEHACFNTLEETFNRRQVRYLVGSPRATVTLAQCDGRIVGWSVGLVRQHRRSRSGRIYAVAVHPQSQGRRLGQSLVEHTLEALGLLGIERVFLEVREGNDAAIRLYRKLGFVDQKRLPNYYGPGRHARSMTLSLLDDREATLFAQTPDLREDRHAIPEEEGRDASHAALDAALQVTRAAASSR